MDDDESNNNSKDDNNHTKDNKEKGKKEEIKKNIFFCIFRCLFGFVLLSMLSGLPYMEFYLCGSYTSIKMTLTFF